MLIRIGTELCEVHDVCLDIYHDTDTATIDTDQGEFVIALNEQEAGQLARGYWKDMAQHDPSEFTQLVGEETLVAWALGQSAGRGTAKVRSLSQWLDVVAEHAHEELASYDGEERKVVRCGTLARELGWMPSVAYRRN